jgi:hypothetical protein
MAGVKKEGRKIFFPPFIVNSSGIQARSADFS